MATVASANISAQNTFTEPARIVGMFNLSISGTFVATVTVQRSIDQSAWHDVDAWTAPTEEVGMEPESQWYRVGVKTGGYTSGTATVRLGQGIRQS